MPSNIYATTGDPGFDGLYWIYQYTNDDGQNKGTVCGQAACATLLTHCGFQRASLETLRKIEKTHAPDLFGGTLGTSPWRIEAILRSYGANYLQPASTIDELKRYVSKLYPVICLIQNKGGLGGLLSDGAHWFVVFAYDNDGVFVTNYGPVAHMSWSDFKEKWDSPVSNLASAKFKGITNYQHFAHSPGSHTYP